MDEERTGAAPPPATGDRGMSAAAYRSLARNRSFRNLALATLSSALGDWIGFLAIIALTATIMEGRAALFAVSGVMIARVVPSLVLAPVAGVFVDRWNRKRILIWTDIGRGLVMALIPFSTDLLALVLATLVIEVMSSLFAPAKDATLPALVRRGELVAANQINLLTTYGTLPLGAALYSGLLLVGGWLAPPGSWLAEHPLAVPIWFNALSFVVSALFIARVTFPPDSQRRSVGAFEQTDPWHQLVEGLRFVGGQPVIRALILGVMVAFAAAGAVITTGEFFARLLNAGPPGYGVLVAVVGIGLVIGLFVAGPITRRIEPERLFAPGIGIAGAALMVTAAMPTLLATILPGLVMGAGAGLAFIVGYTVLQQRADDRLRGRTFGAFNSGVRLAIFGSTITVPFMIGVLGRESRRVRVLVDGSVVTDYPYAFGGIRITLIAAGALAVLGAIWVGWSLSKALLAERGDTRTLKLETADPVPLLNAGVFVVFEGGDGAGKSTQIALLRAALEGAGQPVVVTREPGGTALGEQIRALLLAHDSEGMEPRTEALLYAAARAQHVREVILPALDRGAVVLSDRYVDSSIVYQGAARELGEEVVAELNRWATSAVVPDLTILLDIDPAEGLGRAADTQTPDRIEAAGIHFHQRVRASYHQRAERDPGRYLVLDASLPAEDIHAAIRVALLTKLGIALAEGSVGARSGDQRR